MGIYKGRRWYFSSYLRFPHNVNLPRVGTGAPTNGSSGTGAGTDGPGSLYVNYSTGYWYVNIGTKAAPVWQSSIAGIGSQSTVTAVTASGATPPHTPALYAITKAGVAAMTLAAPTTGAAGTGDDGVFIRYVNTTAFAHTITATGLLQTGSSFTDVVTMNPNAGASLLLMAYAAKWIVAEANGISFS